MEKGAAYIGGKWVRPPGTRLYEVVNPATGERLAEVIHCGPSEVDAAVEAAHSAFQESGWRTLDPSKRERILRKIGDLIESNAKELARIESLQNGKTVREALRGDIPPAWDIFHYYAGWITKYYGHTVPVSGPYLAETRIEPIGVVGAIVPWNFPLLLASWKLAPALAMGNTVVLKPAEQTPLTALYLAELLEEAGIPPGVVNIIPGFGDTGALLARHMKVRKITFTGSREVAREILRASADSNLKRVSLELGGKSPNIVFSDADLDRVSDVAFGEIFGHKGEVCSASSRLLAESSISGELIRRLKDKAERMVLGDPQHPKTQMGSLISRTQLERVERYVSSGLKEGAALVCGGKRHLDNGCDRGFFFRPTIFARVKPHMKIAQEEIFGPVLSVMDFDSEETLIETANSTVYGLVSMIWTRDIGRAFRIARRLESGTVWINAAGPFDSAMPFGGVKESGWGREMGMEALKEYTQVKSIWIGLEY
ncbi:aldehyde dehydrogenase family protein [bacterium]|nr:aldehyde dehydrogenase family protein [bacterium]